MTKMRWLRYCLHRHRDLRVAEIAVGQTLLQILFERAQREPAGLDATQHRERQRAVGVDGELAGQVGLVVDRDDQDVLRADL